jgi:DNA helicase-2/ATP-dependent DNA helicase PcrA
MLSVAGSGKTTHLVRKALDSPNERILITTYTEANELEIKKKFLKINRFIPENVTIQTWFSFLLQHGVRPFQGKIFNERISGMLLVNSASGMRPSGNSKFRSAYGEEKDFKLHYFSPSNKLYSDKLSKFVVRCNERSEGSVIGRIRRIFDRIFIDEVQDLAGNDLEILLLLLNSGIKVLLVGDPRQVTYLTHNERLHAKYSNGKIKEFLGLKAKGKIFVDESTLGHSHRNNSLICAFSSLLYPHMAASKACSCLDCRAGVPEHCGIFLVKKKDIEAYRAEYAPIILKHQLAVEPDLNFGKSKGLGFDRVMIFPTKPIIQYLIDGKLEKVKNGATLPAFDIAKFYVALTRARHSVAIVCDFSNNDTYLPGIEKWHPG